MNDGSPQRLFFAVVPDAAARRALEHLSRQLANAMVAWEREMREMREVREAREGSDRAGGARWIPPSQYHVTLKFLGETAAGGMMSCIEMARRVAERREGFDLTLGGVGAFPDLERPSIVWVGASEGSVALSSLASALDEALVTAGFARDERPYTAHVTLARVRGSRAGRALGRALSHGAFARSIGPQRVANFALMRSVPERGGGVRYEVVEVFSLGGGSPTATTIGS